MHYITQHLKVSVLKFILTNFSHLLDASFIFSKSVSSIQTIKKYSWIFFFTNAYNQFHIDDWDVLSKLCFTDKEYEKDLNPKGEDLVNDS